MQSLHLSTLAFLTLAAAGCRAMNTGRSVPVVAGTQFDHVTPRQIAYNIEVEEHAHRIRDVIREHGRPIRPASPSQYWVAAVAGAPTQLLVTTVTALDTAAQLAVNASREQANDLLRGTASVWSSLVAGITHAAMGVAKAADAPAKALREGLLGGTDDVATLAPAADVHHVVVAASEWPELPTNRATNVRVRAHAALAAGSRFPYDILIVPGYASDDQRAPLSATTERRLDQAARDLESGLAPFILVTGGNVHPVGTLFNEAFEMRRYLIEEHRVAASRIIVECHAEHSTTNLRNAGRYMRRFGLQDALVVSTPTPVTGQSFYFQTADAPTYGFHMRTMVELGHRVGTLEPLDAAHTKFTPSTTVNWVALVAGERVGRDP